MSPEERQEIIDELRLKYYNISKNLLFYNNVISKNHKSFKKFTTK